MRFGICCYPGVLVSEQKNEPLSALPQVMEVLQAAGADYLEFSVASVMPESDEHEFEKLKVALAPYTLRVEAFCSFIPRHFPIVGPLVDLGAVLNYCRTALRRCSAIGADVVVLGSAGARKIPPGFDRAKAEEQFIEFCRALGPVANDNGIDIAIEPLNQKEDNLIVSVEHGIRMVDAIAHPRIRLLADLYHIAVEKEPLSHVASGGHRLCHTHVADKGRAAPGFSQEGEEDFVGFFRQLRLAGYDGRCSFEGSFGDMKKQARPAMDLLRKRWIESL